MKFEGTLEVQELPDGVHHRLAKPFGLFLDGRIGQYPATAITVPLGFVTDYASIPPLARIAGMVLAIFWLSAECGVRSAEYGIFAAWIVVMLSDSLLHTGRYQTAAVIHDFIYKTHCFPRGQADWILYRAMALSGTPRWKRMIIYLNVRLFGWMAWGRRRRPIAEHRSVQS